MLLSIHVSKMVEEIKMQTKRIIFAVMAFFLIALTAEAQRVYRSKTGIIIHDMGDSIVRAMEPFKGVPEGGKWYSDALNQYPRKAGDGVRFYSMVIPTSAEYYLPASAKNMCSAEKPVMNNMKRCLSDSITWVDVYTVLSRHVKEPIYARTDHHWLPLGGYYAAKEFARIANVPFRELSEYKKMVIYDYVGSMARFSRDPKVRTSPEEFVYYVPKDSTYSTTFVGHNVGKRGVVLSVTEPFDGPFFVQHKQGSGSAYCTFMGGDYRTTHVKTEVKNGRVLMIIKDSYGNALPAYLFSSFQEIYVVDFRYFTKNIIDFIKERKVTDVLFANNLQHAYSHGTSNKLVGLLNK